MSTDEKSEDEETLSLEEATAFAAELLQQAIAQNQMASDESFFTEADERRYIRIIERELRTPVNGFIQNLAEPTLTGLFGVIKENYPENEAVKNNIEAIEWWCVTPWLWGLLADSGGVTIEFQWDPENDENCYLWGKEPNEYPVAYDPLLLALWQSGQLVIDAESIFDCWDVDELKTIFQVAHKNLLTVPMLMDSEWLMNLQGYLQMRAQENEVDPKNHSEWESWLNLREV